MKTIQQLEEEIELLKLSLETNTKDSKYFRTKSGALKRRRMELEKLNENGNKS